MKKFKNILSLVLTILLIFTGSCSYIDGFGEDPNNAGDAPTTSIMSAAMMGYDVSLTVQDAWYAAVWTQQLTGQAIQWIGINNYDVTSSSFDWEPEYYGCLTQCNLAIEKLQADENRIGVGIMTVIQAHMYGHVAALWGDVPFSAALQFTEGITNPTYDNQLSVYEGVQELLDEAIVDLGSGIGSDLDADLFYDGDVTKWIEVAHTLKARYYLHVKDYANAITNAEQGISSDENSLRFPHTLGIQLQDMNLWHSFLTIDRPGDIGARDANLAKLLDVNQPMYRGNAKTDESNRFAFYYTAPTNAGDVDYDINTSDEGIFARTASDELLTFSENQLILAEAHLRKDAPDANAALEVLNSVRQALSNRFGENLYQDYALEDFAPSGIAGIAGATTEEALLFEVTEEKYACLFGNIEAFNDLTRTKNLIGLTPKLGNQIPERYLLPEEETNANSNAPNPIPGLFDITAVNQIPL
ncbi:MAG: SusD/RagB family nutrient-binding outer membrane lipoprotein [Bacteroidota bacterium]